MALRNQPYIPLYVQDYLTDEKLNECSASAQGIYIKIMCIMHKSEEYGTILLKQKDKQNESNIYNFAVKLARLLPFTTEEINDAVKELISESVLTVDGDKMIQRRMVKDNDTSIKRALAGKKGGKNTQFALAKKRANSEDEIEDEIEIENKGVVNKFVPPTIEEVKLFFKENEYSRDGAEKAYHWYNDRGWKNAKGKQVLNWKSTMRNNWFNPEYKLGLMLSKSNVL